MEFTQQTKKACSTQQAFIQGLPKTIQHLLEKGAVAFETTLWLL